MEFNQENIDPLDRPVLSLRDDEVLDKNFLYVNEFFIDRSVLDLGIMGNAPVNVGGNLTPDQFGNLAPAAGGNLGDLAPSAGGIAVNATTTCVNNFLDSGWNSPAAQPGAETCGGEPTAQ